VDAHELDLTWDRRGRRLAIEGKPVWGLAGVIPLGELRHYPDEPTRIELRAEQAEELAGFLAERPQEESPRDQRGARPGRRSG
jgi:hypothetical protein